MSLGQERIGWMLRNRDFCSKNRVPYVKPDGWAIGGKLFKEEDMPSPFEYRLETGYTAPLITDIAVRLVQTGKKAVRKWSGEYYRVLIVFPGDGEPDEVTRGIANIEALELCGAGVAE